MHYSFSPASFYCLFPKKANYFTLYVQMHQFHIFLIITSYQEWGVSFQCQIFQEFFNHPPISLIICPYLFTFFPNLFKLKLICDDYHLFPYWNAQLSQKISFVFTEFLIERTIFSFFTPSDWDLLNQQIIFSFIFIFPRIFI